MIFLLIGTLFLLLKLGQVEPIAHWSWIVISCPFFIAIVWLEWIEPLLGLDVRRQHRQHLRFLKRFDKKNDYLSRQALRRKRMAAKADTLSQSKNK